MQLNDGRGTEDDRLSVLLIDDDDDGLMVMTQVLLLQGYATEAATSVDEGLERYYARRHHVVISDIDLGKRTGLEVAGELAGKEGSPLLISVIGSTEPGLEARSRRAGFDEHMTKPVDWDNLKTILSGVQH